MYFKCYFLSVCTKIHAGTPARETEKRETKDAQKDVQMHREIKDG